MNKHPLVSFIVVSYNNYHLLYETLESVLSQDYQNIELVISNDGSKDFNQIEVINYLKKNKNKNITNFIVNNNKKNLGTVKNINKAIKSSNGKYIMILAADDVLYDKTVISKTIESFNKLPKSELIVVSQIGMYDFKLKKLIQLFVSPENINKIKTLSPQKLFGEMSTKCILPGCGICYKKEIFKKYGYFDEKYLLIEDYSSALKFSRLGIKYNFLNFISCKHRDGGISHGNVNGESLKSRQYELDILNILKNEILPFKSLLNSQQKKEFIKKYKNQKWKFLYNYIYKDKSKAQKRKAIKDNLDTIISSFLSDFFREFLDQFKGKKFKILLTGIIFLISSILFKNYLNIILKNIGFFLIIVSTLMMVLYLFKKFLLRFIKFIRFII